MTRVQGVIARSSIRTLSPYTPGRSAPGRSDGSDAVQRIIKMSSNESALGPSPHVRRAAMRESNQWHRYPDALSNALRQALAQRHGLEAERIVCGNGSDDLILTLAKSYAGEGDEIIMSRYGFTYYTNAAAIVGARLIKVDECESPQSIQADVDALIRACSDRTRLLFLANPNNPTGSWLERAAIQRLVEHIPSHVLLVLDGAYAEYMVDEHHSQNHSQRYSQNYSPGHELVDRFPNVVTIRTFSKIFGLAGLRIGWAYADRAVVDVLHAVRAPFSVNAVAARAALAALADTPFTDRVRSHTLKWRDWLEKQLKKHNIHVYPSVGNFLLLRFAGTNQARSAENYVRQHGVLLRTLDEYDLPDCLRISISRATDNRLVARLLGQWMKENS